jgi:hypothetical protein
MQVAVGASLVDYALRLLSAGELVDACRDADPLSAAGATQALVLQAPMVWFAALQRPAFRGGAAQCVFGAAQLLASVVVDSLPLRRTVRTASTPPPRAVGLAEEPGARRHGQLILHFRHEPHEDGG